MTRRVLFVAVASLAGVRLRHADPERTDDDNPELTLEELQRARPAAEVLPELIGQEATDALMRDNVELRAEQEEPIGWSGCPLVEIDPDIQSGAPVLHGTRMPVSAIVDNADAGESAGDIAAMFELPLERVEAILAYADNQRWWARIAARGEARRRALLQAEGRDPDRMSEDEVEDYISDYVERVIDEYRRERRERKAQSHPG